MSDIISSNKIQSFFIGQNNDVDNIYKTSRALASYDRIHILQLLIHTPLSIYEISKKLKLPISSVSNHIAILEDANLIYVSTQQGAKRHVKMCSKQISEMNIKFNFNNPPKSSEYFTTEMPVGYFSDAKISPPCGMYIIDKSSQTEKMCSTDNPSEFFSPERFNAELLWFDYGFVSYNFPNKLFKKNISKIEISFELCSEAVYHKIDWPSDISFKLNDVDAFTFTSPGDFGGRYGKFSPQNWNINSTQYGQLYKIIIDQNGCYLNNVLVSKNNIDHFSLANNPFIKMSIGVDENAVHRGGLNLFGSNFGDHNQAIILTIYS